MTLPHWRDQWNQEHCRLVATGLFGASRNTAMVEWAVKQLEEAKKVYYTSGEAIMEDVAYDWLEDLVKYLDADNAFFNKVGYEIGEK